MQAVEILFVEDDPAQRALALRALDATGLGARVRVAADAAEALELLLAPSSYELREEPRLVLLDLDLPGPGGLDVLRTIRSEKRTRLIPVVVLTSSTDADTITEAYRAGANSYVAKEADAEAHARRIAQIAAYWLTCNRSPG